MQTRILLFGATILFTAFVAGCGTPADSPPAGEPAAEPAPEGTRTVTLHVKEMGERLQLM